MTFTVSGSIVDHVRFLMMGILDHVRKRIAARMGEQITASIEQPVFKYMAKSKRAGTLPVVDPMNDRPWDTNSVTRQPTRLTVAEAVVRPV